MMEESPNPTWADVKQLGWGLLLPWGLIAVLAALTRHYFGARTALLVGLGLGALVAAALVLITAVSLLVSYGAEWLHRHQDRRRGRRAG